MCVCWQAAWLLKMRALTEQLYVDEVDIDEEGIAETLLDSNAIASVPKPGTSLKQPTTAAAGAISRGVRYSNVVPPLLLLHSFISLFSTTV